MSRATRQSVLRVVILLSLSFAVTAAWAEEDATVQAASKGFVLGSGDKSFTFQPTAYLQVLGRGELTNTAVADGFALRRFRPGFAGRLADRVSTYALIDFAGDKVVVLDSWGEVKLPHGFNARIGKMKVPFGLERLQSPKATFFLERAFTESIAPNRDTGVQLLKTFLNQSLETQIGLFNGTGDGAVGETNSDDSFDAFFRAGVRPRIGSLSSETFDLLLNGAISFGKRKNDKGLTQFKSPGRVTLFTYSGNPTSTIADGDLLRWQGSLYATSGASSLLGEYMTSCTELTSGGVHGRIRATAWQVAGSYVFGGKPGFKGVAIDKGAANGAVELKGRVHGFFVNSKVFYGFALPDNNAKQAVALGTGLNWYFIQNSRVIVDFEHTLPEAQAGNLPDETVLTVSFQYSF
jgi:phosphate-selective porin OprO/OprP